MNDAPEPSDPGREEARRLVESFAGDEETAVVAVLADAAEPGASWRGAAALAGASAARRRTLLVNLAGPGSGLDGFLEVEGREGLHAVRAGDRKLSEAAVRPAGRDFLYLPAGDPDPSERPGPALDRDFVDALRRLADGIREAGGLLLLYLEAGALPSDLAGDLVDGAVPLAGADPHLPAGVPTLGRLSAGEEPASGAGSADGDEGPPAPDAPGEGGFLPGVPGGDAAGAGPAGSRAGGGGLGERGGSGAPGEIDLPEPPPVEDEEGEGGDDGAPDDAGSGGDEAPVGPAAREAGAAADGSGGRAPGDDADDGADDGADGPDEGAAEDGPVEEDGPPAGEGASDDGAPDDGDEGWRRHRRSLSPPWGKIAAGAAAVLLLAAGWWWLADRAAAGGDAADAGGAVDTAGTPPAASADTGAGERGRPSGGAAAPEEVVASAAELGRSVLVASFSSWPAARDRAEELRSERGGVWIVAPTPVGGSLYWRLYAGAAADEDAGRELMGRLVEDGVKDRVRGWDIRPTPLAYRVDAVPGRAAAEERAAGLRERGLPAYVLAAAAAGDTVWQVYAGAYESRGAAERLGEMLEEAGVTAELVTRRGEEGGA